MRAPCPALVAGLSCSMGHSQNPKCPNNYVATANRMYLDPVGNGPEQEPEGSMYLYGIYISVKGMIW